MRASEKLVRFHRGLNRFSILSVSQVYNELRTHNDIRYAIKKVEKTSDKVFLLIQVGIMKFYTYKVLTLPQAILGNIPLNTPEMRRGDTQPQADALFIFKHAVRLAKGSGQLGELFIA